MITLQLNSDQVAFLEAALEKAMDNECDAEYYGAYEDLAIEIDCARKVAITETDDVDVNTDKVWRERYGEE